MIASNSVYFDGSSSRRHSVSLAFKDQLEIKEGENTLAMWSYADIRRIMLESFATKHSLALQQTLYYMGEQVIDAHPGVAEVRMSMPNKHHFLVDLSPFGQENDNEVYHADDRPYGLIEGTVLREDAPDAGLAWLTVPGFC